MGTSPGNINFENRPFKLTKEYVDLMGGEDSDTFKYFRYNILKGFLVLRKHAKDIISLLEMMSKNSDLPIFKLKNTI